MCLKLFRLLLILLSFLLLGAMEHPPEAVPWAEPSEPEGLNSFSFAFEVYDKVISPIDGDRCRMYPSCSQYSKEAIAQRGLFLGILMSADRIMRCGMDTKLYNVISIGEKDYYDDPPK